MMKNIHESQANLARLYSWRQPIKDKTFFTAEDAEEKHEGFPLRPLR